ncbi:hypothetical protein XELAEV_18007256mg [Xenopus laevis]|uniref:Ig-like domain-containing protein n=1 Tax=Xenopus laevis TaxID=8355 RepID=A0A974I4J5_XENLA|nr:hypothetical protein XELAEV_18007256mg [Xenopus laevis]
MVYSPDPIVPQSMVVQAPLNVTHAHVSVLARVIDHVHRSMELDSCVVGNSINSKEQYISGHVGENVTLTCEFSTSSETPYLFWYCQYPNKMEYLLYRGAKGYSSITRDGNYEKGKFDSSADDTSTKLTIFSLTVEDSAVYLCALSVTAQWCLNITVQCKNLPL